MKVVLLKDVKNIGKRDEIVTVSELLGDERVVPGTSVYHAR